MVPAVSATARSPLSGCAILIGGVLMLVFLIGFSIWTPFRQAAEIERFTRESPVELEVEPVEGNPAAEALRTRIRAFGEQLEEGEGEVRLGLGAEELNLAIALYPAMEELRGTFRVREIDDESMRIDICYGLNGRPRLARDDEEGFVTSDPRYLVGTIHGHPVLSGRELVLRVDELEVEGAEIPEGFMGHFSTLRLFEASKTDPEIGPAMARLTRAGIEDGRLVVARVPGEEPPGVVSDEAFRRGGSRIATFLGFGTLLFLLVAGTFAYRGYRRQLREMEASEAAGDAGGVDKEAP